jgi:predicted component of type VI protein secretion system
MAREVKDARLTISMLPSEKEEFKKFIDDSTVYKGLSEFVVIAVREKMKRERKKVK